MKFITSSKSTVFLIEMTIVILIFAFCSAITLGLFANAHKLDIKSGSTSMAIMKTQSIAESIKNASSLPDLMLVAENGANSAVAATAAGTGFFDGNWNAVSSEQDAVFKITADVRTESAKSGTMAFVDLAASAIGHADDPLFELSVHKYFAE